MASVNLNLPLELKVVSLVDWTHDQVVSFLNANKEVLNLEPDTLQLVASVPKLKGPQAAYLKVGDWRNLGIGLLDAPSLFDVFEKVREIQREAKKLADVKELGEAGDISMEEEDEATKEDFVDEVEWDRLAQDEKERLSLHVLDPKRIYRIKRKRGYTPRLGGEGGTLEIGSPRRNAVWEGIDLSDTRNIKRHATVERLLANIDEEGFFLVRSPPMAGKTSLAQLVERAAIALTFRESRPRRIIRMSLLWMGKAKMEWNFEEEFAKLMGGTTWLNFVNECRTAKTLLIIDELQATTPRHGGEVFWSTMKWIQQKSNLSVLGFATYGYRGAYGDSEDYVVSPWELPNHAIWGIEELRFTNSEFLEYFNAFTNPGLHDIISSSDLAKLRTSVWNMTLGHPGFVACILYWLRSRYESRIRDGDSLSYREIFLEMTNPDFIDSLKTTRASKNVDRLTQEEVKLCDEVFRSPGGLQLHNLPAESVDSFRRLRRTFLLTETHDEGRRRVLDFAAPILRTLFLHEKYGRMTRASFAPTDLFSFLRDAFRNMDGKVLRESLGRGTDGRVLEAVWQNEFYRVATQLLSKDEVVSVNVGPVFKSEGYVDFFIGPKQKWAIELARDGDRIQQHQARWDDIYCDIAAVANEAVVVDIRRPGLSSRKSKFPAGFYMVECLKDFEAVRITPPNGAQPEIVPLAGNEASSEGLLLPYQAR